MHHIFPKAQLYKLKFARPEVNALANFCFLTKETNLSISDNLPEEYFPEIEKNYPGALASQWIPTDPALWKIKNYRDFLEARKTLLADEMNRCMKELLHGDTRWLEGPASSSAMISADRTDSSVSSESEEALDNLNNWVEQQGLPRGVLSYDFSDPKSGEQQAVFDLAWPNGIQEELSQPVAVLLNENVETLKIASRTGYRCFTAVQDFKHYVEKEILSELAQ